MPPRVHSLITEEVLADLYIRQDLSLAKVAAITETNVRLVKDSLAACGLRPRTKSEAAKGRPFDEGRRSKLRTFRTGLKDTEDVRARKAEVLKTAGGRGWNRGLSAETDVRMARMRDASQRAMRDPDFRNRLSEAATNRIIRGHHWRTGRYLSPKRGESYYMSSWELRRFQELDLDPEVLSWVPQPFSIQYEWEGCPHRYVPDLLVHCANGVPVLEEIKPPRLVQKARSGDPKYTKLLAKLNAGEAYANTHGMIWRIVSFQKDGASFTST